jgi:hypothetical protein
LNLLKLFIIYNTVNAGSWQQENPAEDGFRLSCTGKKAGGAQRGFAKQNYPSRNDEHPDKAKNCINRGGWRR